MIFCVRPLFATGKGIPELLQFWYEAAVWRHIAGSGRDSRGRLSLHQNLSWQRISHISQCVGHHGHSCRVFAQFAGNYFVEGVGGGVVVVEIG